MEDRETPIGLAPSADPPAQKRRKVFAGRGIVMVIASIAVGAFILYAFIAMYGILSSQ
ncbi:hypothetical protein LJR098_006184 [Rhizobium sp. LjRoot98]|uniref:hypothetical protein n=1 Tax=unclassified Rhizobium TaxID=2613769 RepID=UPI000ABA78BF|nr:hypothetical protein [Rhizobium sp. Root1204]